MNKGFTLVELLGALIILSILILISVPAIGKVLEDSKQKSYEFQLTQIESAAKSWGIDNVLFKIDNGDVVTITLAQLKVSGYIGKNVSNPINNTSFPNDMEILLTREGLSIRAELLLETGSDVTELSSDVIVFILNGRTVENVEINTVYNEEEIEFFNGLGEEVNHVKEMSYNGVVVTEIDESLLGQYIITYTATSGTSVSKVVRTINIVDTTPPVISFPGTIEIAIDDLGTLNLNTGVTVTDNSLETLSYTIIGSVEPEIGNYAITYISEDSSGNVSQKSRLVKVIAN